MDHASPSSTFTFPFGQPLLPVAGGDAAGREFLIIGSSPSALGIRWRVPGGKFLQGLVVDNDPAPFWDGHDQEARVKTWKQLVCWQDSWGEAGPAKGNGTDGQWLNQQVLAPLGLTRDRVCAMTLLDTYHANDSMLHRIEDHYRPLIERLGLKPCSLPRLPGNEKLIEEAIATHGERLKNAIRTPSIQTVITLGTAAMKAFLELRGGSLAQVSKNILTDGMLYGQAQELAWEGRTLQWCAFINPNAPMGMQTVHKAWAEQRGMKPLVHPGVFK